MQSFYFKFSEGELRKIGLFLRYPENIDVQNVLPQSGYDCCRKVFKGWRSPSPFYLEPVQNNP